MKTQPLTSDCCKQPIVSEGDHDRCSQCKRQIQYALVGRYDNEACGVCRLYDGTLWFFWQIVSTWDQVTRSCQEYVGQVEAVVTTMGLLYDTQDTDFLDYRLHKRFSDSYRGAVKNPEYAL